MDTEGAVQGKVPRRGMRCDAEGDWEVSSGAGLLLISFGYLCSASWARPKPSTVVFSRILVACPAVQRVDVGPMGPQIVMGTCHG